MPLPNRAIIETEYLATRKDLFIGTIEHNNSKQDYYPFCKTFQNKRHANTVNVSLNEHIYNNFYLLYCT